ncbi:Piso0_005003 [Millerozyma farinosa CBS 7064]|uniref:Piso0_005003 protein n=1 Tax=Pichia sorbitophila (strain ATCC MYA-4447 / BCRC 22081 / CBS 7064 / NBRC 10061 / NRRL Y-12695) TaxID=559304 RepID=G8Y3Y9_PICSO|nr:Piso0_005003 [Millerozyma farinosa CBS 7064]
MSKEGSFSPAVKYEAGADDQSYGLDEKNIFVSNHSIDGSPLDKDVLGPDTSRQYDEQPNTRDTFGDDNIIPPTNSSNNVPRLILAYDKPRFTHSKSVIHELQTNDNSTLIYLNDLERYIEDKESFKGFRIISLFIEYNDEFVSNLGTLNSIIENNQDFFNIATDVTYHIQFDPSKKYKDYSEEEIQEYHRFLQILSEAVGDKVTHCSILSKYEISTLYLTEKEDLITLGKQIQGDIEKWKNLCIFDYSDNCIRFLPGVRFPDTLEVFNFNGGHSLETLAGFKMPPNLKTLKATMGALNNIDNVSFPHTLETLDLHDNKIFFLNYVDFPSGLKHLDLSKNAIDNLRGAIFPSRLKNLSLALNPIECVKGIRLPEGLEYLDLSYIPNESMTGIKFPDSLIALNLQQSMTNTRGLKLPNALKELNLGNNGVNSINPLKLPNTIQSLYLKHNNIKTLNKVQLPTDLRELYLGNNLITTLKNVSFPPGLEVLDLSIDPNTDESDKHITTLKDVTFPPSLKVLRLAFHSIRSLEMIEFPPNLEELSLAYNELKFIRNVKLGPNLKLVDLSGNGELTNLDHLTLPPSVVELRLPSILIPNLPAYIVERANSKKLILKRSVTFKY